MGNVLKYKEYQAKLEVSIEDGVLFGKVEGLSDLVTFEAQTPAQAQQAFEEAVDDYLAFCQQVGKEPERMYKGTFNVRISPENHRALDQRAKKDGDTLNRAIEKAVEMYLSEPRRNAVLPVQVQPTAEAILNRKLTDRQPHIP